MQKEHPILFSTDMVNAILDKRKVMTRRLKGLEEVNKNPESWIARQTYEWQSKHDKSVYAIMFDGERTIILKCPYGNIGDLLYVRETWVNLGYNNCDFDEYQENYVVFKASENGREWEENMEGWRWKPGIHLPKKDSRIWLEITGIKVERLQDIPEADAMEEGVERIAMPECSGFWNYIKNSVGFSSATGSFQSLWEKINGPESWAANPWVWAITFKVISTDGKPEKNDRRHNSI
jgi:hypothetical protein